jgi:phosphorylcholine metabolism protein LicD
MLRDRAFEGLCRFKEVMNNAKIPFMLINGLLLGLHRDGEMVRNDETDIDIFVWFEYSERFREIIEELEENELFVRCLVNTHQKLIKSITLRYKGISIDVSFASKRDGMAFQYFTKVKDTNPQLYKVFTYPTEIFMGIGEVKWRGVGFPCPSRITEYLNVRYGNSWRVPILKGEGWDSHNKKLNPCLRDNWTEEDLGELY